MAKNDFNKFLNAVSAGKKAADRMNFGVINTVSQSDYVGSDIHNASSTLDFRRDAFVFGFHLWGSDDQKVI